MAETVRPRVQTSAAHPIHPDRMLIPCPIIHTARESKRLFANLSTTSAHPPTGPMLEHEPGFQGPTCSLQPAPIPVS